MIRPTGPVDTPALLALAEGTGVFKPSEIVALREVLDDYHAANASAGHRAATLLVDSRPAGFVYFAPAAMTDRGWYLWWVVVEKERQGEGLGTRLVRHAEDVARASSARYLWIETSSTPHYEPTRRFYTRLGYTQAARLPDFYADGDDLVVFAKRLSLPQS
jgi:ribosomal protein S18 acetylase RimI-like enzyme